MRLPAPLPGSSDSFRPVPGDSRNILTVSEVTRQIKALLEKQVGHLWVTGEVSNLKVQPSGHHYFTFKDAGSQLSAVLFAGIARSLPFRLQDGQELILYGAITVYEPRGQYQIKVLQAEPKGIGGLLLAFQQLKDRLEREGLFDRARKRTLPYLPRRIAIVTSPVGAALRDMLNIIDRRFPDVEVWIAPARVQGEGAAQEIAAAIRLLNTMSGIDVMIVGRGGGSLVDLWAFIEEVVARAIVASKIPVISAVGHEVDVTISDLVADVRAKTPSEAAELVVPLKAELLERLHERRRGLEEGMMTQVRDLRRHLDALASGAALREPHHAVQTRMQRLDESAHRLGAGLRETIARRRKQLEAMLRRLEAQSPRRILTRRYQHLREINADRRLAAGLWQQAQRARRRVDQLAAKPAFVRWPQGLLRRRSAMDALRLRLASALSRRSVLQKHRVVELEGKLKALGPRGVLDRGYSISYRVRGNELLRSAKLLAPGERIRTVVASGEFTSLVERVKPGGAPRSGGP